MTIVDTHCHTGLDKYEPVESLLFHMEQSGVEKAVLIQHMGTTDNSYHVECLRQYPHRFKSAMIVEDNDNGSGIWQWADQGINGIRLPADSRSNSSDPLAYWRAAAELNLVVSAPGGPAAFTGGNFQEVLRLFPGLQFVIEHLGGFGLGRGTASEEREMLRALAQHPNLTIKLPGFGEICELPYPFQEVPKAVRDALEHLDRSALCGAAIFRRSAPEKGIITRWSFRCSILRISANKTASGYLAARR